ncbi:Chemotaxis protein CheY [Anaerohalosphaera lusitana]|uniref:Chemotaxis protein CheY n=1 Tax=Anaerohalosphaera lusitana TaxID=1936003 RepID=A0A1U9NIT1_9BACT|nr:response regulator [Anaerohalosphaera lusitana]AQT67416.1 Chemotaxis protein CheY [Anaerohalosphaera lusitana]
MLAAKTILFAEDNLGNFVLTKRHLRRWGIESSLIRFGSGQKLLDYVDNNIAQANCSGYIVILDIQLPGLNGVEVLKDIRRSKKSCELPVLMLSTTDRQTTIDKCMQIGADAYFVKPLSKPAFFRALDRLGMPEDNLDDSGISQAQHVSC